MRINFGRLRRFHLWSLRLAPVGAAAVALIVATACGGAGGGGPGAGDSPDLALAEVPPDMTEVDMVAPGYPAGPYGTSVGDVLENLTFKGYFSPSKTTGLAKELPFGDVSLDQLRKSGAKVAHVSSARRESVTDLSCLYPASKSSSSRSATLTGSSSMIRIFILLKTIQENKT